MKLLAGTLVTLASSALGKHDIRKQFRDDRVLHLSPDVLTDSVRELLHAHDADHIGREEDLIAVKMSAQAVEALQDITGSKFEDATENWISKFQSNFDDPNFLCEDSAEVCAGREAQDFYSSYQSLEAIQARIRTAVDGSSLGNIEVIGQSYEGRDLWAVEIGDSSKPLAYFMCNIHAREWLPTMYCPYMIETLLENGGHPLLDTFSFAIIPSGNPDGFVYTRNGEALWRKTRKPNSGSSCIGTDPNRNYDDHHCGTGASTSPCSDTYCGTAPFDNPETAAIDRYAASRSDNLISWIDFHSYGGYWLSPLGWSTGLPPAVDYDRMEQCMVAVRDAIRDVNGLNFLIGGAGDVLYPAAGASDDYFYSGYGVIYSYTCEMRGSSFQPSSSNIIPNNLEVFAGMVAQMECIAEIELGATDPPTAPTVSAPTVPPTEPPTTACWFFC